MSSHPTGKTKDDTTKSERPSVSITLPTGNLQAGIKALTNSPLSRELELFTLKMEQHKDLFKNVALMQQRVLDDAFLPLKKLTEMLNTISTFQRELGGVTFITQRLAQAMVVDTKVLEIANKYNNLQIQAFAGVVIKSDIGERTSRAFNGISEVSTVRSTRVMAGGMVSLGINKNTSSTLTAQVAYQKIETIETRVQLLNHDLATTKEDVATIKQLFTSNNSIIEVLQNNPFPFFKIKNVNYNSQGCHFIVNDQIVIKIPKYSHMEDLCTVLFSGKQGIDEPWFLDTIQSAWEALVDNEKAKSLTWKQILTIVDQLNTLFAKKTTKEDLIEVHRPGMIKLNPVYFLPN